MKLFQKHIKHLQTNPLENYNFHYLKNRISSKICLKHSSKNNIYDPYLLYKRLINNKILLYFYNQIGEKNKKIVKNILLKII